MNAVTALERGIDPVLWNEAADLVNAWRGQALHCFVQAEVAVSETLLTMSTASDDAPVPLRHLVGQRFEDLSAAIGDDGPFPMDTRKAVSALAEFRRLETLRSFLCHGMAKVALDKQGDWLVVLRVLTFRGGKHERLVLTYDRREAEAVLAELTTASRQLTSALQSLRARIAGTTGKRLG